jgi:hypothetical protein
MLPTPGQPAALSPGDEPPHSPADCAVAFAIPVRRDQFERGAQSANCDFVPRLVEANPGRSLASLWEEYCPLAGYALDLAAEARRAGALVEEDVSITGWSRLLRHRPVVVLVAHWRRGEADAIEFAESLYPPNEVADAVPADFSGVLDFTTCYSLHLAAAVKTRARRSQVILNRYEARLDFRLAMLRQTLRLLQNGKFSYVAAMAQVHLALIRKGKTR